MIDAKANVCSVQFSPVSSNLLAFGSANYRVYLYDLRQMQVRLLALCCMCGGLCASANLSRVWRHQNHSSAVSCLSPCLSTFVLGPPSAVSRREFLVMGQTGRLPETACLSWWMLVYAIRTWQQLSFCGMVIQDFAC